MAVAFISGSAGLIGSEAALNCAEQGMTVVGIDNDMRRAFFGEEASTLWQRRWLEERLGSRYRHIDGDIRDETLISRTFQEYGANIRLVIHCAAQPSHDWAARDPRVDFSVNANGTLNLLESTRRHAAEAVFVFLSTNKVYGDAPNRLPLVEQELRFEIGSTHPYVNGIAEDMSLDQCLHSLFGASKLAADVLVQEYGRYFGMRTVCFRGGCLTGPNHSGAELHGFLAYLMQCTATGRTYRVFGYKGKQVRDNIHSLDMIRAIMEFCSAPQVGAVYNIGGGRFSNCSMLEAIEMSQAIAGRELNWSYSSENRIGDHRWWITDNSKFMRDYPRWRLEYDVNRILREIYERNEDRWAKTHST